MDSTSRLTWLACCLLVSGHFVCGSPYSPPDNFEETTFDWKSVSPSTGLEYHKCYEGLQCARLEVPLDWNNASNKNTVVLAIARIPAKVPLSDPSFGGTILLNPGGPGGSGIDVLRWTGYGVQEIVDDQKHFEILSWDPRGIQYTTPSPACFGDNISRQLFALKTSAVGTLDASTSAFNMKWAAAKGFGELCANSSIGMYSDGSNIRQFMSTSLVARDMVRIIDKVEERLRREDRTQGGADDQQQSIFSAIDAKPALLNYWGHSYGSYLGNTFASMFPGRVGRMVLDGVVDAMDYAATGWTSNMQDNKKNLAILFQYCFEAGERCALFDESYSGPSEIQSKVEAYINALVQNPVPVVHNGTVELITYLDVAGAIHAAQYFPNQLWPGLAEVLSDLLNGKTASMIPYLKQLSLPRNPAKDSTGQPFLVSTSLPFNNKTQALPPDYPHGTEAGRAVLCGDGDDITSTTKEQFQKYVDLLIEQSPIAGRFWAEITLYCTGWPRSLRPAEHNRFTGPFTSALSDYDPRASPLLFLGNTADNVTPVRNALKMAGLHEGARVLVQDSVGHCSSPNNPSACTFTIVKDFFATGKLPPEGTVCQGSKKPFDL